MCSTSRNAINFFEITPFGEMDVLSPPGSKSLVKRKAWGGFWGCLYRKVTISTQNANLDEIHRLPHISTKMVGNRGISTHFSTLGWKGHPETSPEPYISLGNSPRGGEGPALSPKGGHFSGIVPKCG